MDIKTIKKLVSGKKYTLSGHAVKRKSLRKITNKEIEESVQSGDVIEEAPDDKPYPSCLMQGTTKSERVLNVAVALNEKAMRAVIITAYEFDEDEWSKYLRRKERRKHEK